LIAFAASNSKAQETMSLSTFLNKVKEQNLDLKVESAKRDALEAKSVGLAIPPPMVSVNQMNMETGDTARGFEVNQAIPFPTKLTSDHSARDYAAKSQNEFRLARQNEILAQAKVLYFSLWASQEKLNLLSEKKNVIKNHIKLARSSARSDSFAGVHVLRAESDLDLLENEILTAEQVLNEKQNEVAVLINVDPSFKIVAEDPLLSEVPKIDSIDSSHQVQMMKFSLESLRSKESQAKSSWFPDLNIRYKEMGASNMYPRYNEVMVGVTLPFVFFWQPNSESKAASSERLQAEYEVEKQRRTIDADKKVLLSKLESLKKQIDTLKKKLIPRTERRMKLVHNLAPRDMETLQDHRETMEAFPDLKLKALELRLEYEQAVSALEKYLPSQKDNL
jgi:outer membrane protein TolC